MMTSTDLRPLFETIVKHIPAPAGDPEACCSCWLRISITAITSGGWRIGRVFNGTLQYGDDVAIAKLDGSLQKTRITKLYSFEGLKRVDETVGVHGRHSGDRRSRGHHYRRDVDQRRRRRSRCLAFRSTSRRSR